MVLSHLAFGIVLFATKVHSGVTVDATSWSKLSVAILGTPFFS